MATPCWKALTTDWAADGRVDGAYPPRCYHQAVAHLHTDLAVYSNARDDILRALQRAVAGGGPRAAAASAKSGPPLPLPLVVLASLALLLLLAGALGLVRSRRRADPHG